MNKITIEEFVKRVNALKAGEHISVQILEGGYIVTAFATLVKGNRYHFMMVEGFYGNCEQGFEGFDEQGVYEYIDYVKELEVDTSELDEITELIVVEEKKDDKEKKELIQKIFEVIVCDGDDGAIGISDVYVDNGKYEIEYLSIDPNEGITFHSIGKHQGEGYNDCLDVLDMETLEEIYIQIQ